MLQHTGRRNKTNANKIYKYLINKYTRKIKTITEIYKNKHFLAIIFCLLKLEIEFSNGAI